MLFLENVSCSRLLRITLKFRSTPNSYSFADDAYHQYMKYCYQHSGTADGLDALRVDTNVSQQLNNS